MARHSLLAWSLLVGSLFLLSMVPTASLARVVAAQTERVSVATGGSPAGNNASDFPSISDDGRVVAFVSQASNLVPGDTQTCGVDPFIINCPDIFVHDRDTVQTERVSVSSTEEQANAGSRNPSISGDGRYVAFESDASNLVLNDANTVSDIFVRDRVAGTTELISVGLDAMAAGGTLPRISADGRYVAFASQGSNLVIGDAHAGWDVYVRDRTLGTTILVSVSSAEVQGNGDSGVLGLDISPDGGFVAFASIATNLVGSDTNGATSDIFLRDLAATTTTLISVDSNEAQTTAFSTSPSVSANGLFVAFASDRLTAGDTNMVDDGYVRDVVAGTTEVVTVNNLGQLQTDGAINRGPSISDDGRYVAFISSAMNLTAPAPDANGMKRDAFLRDRLAGTTELVSQSTEGVQGDADSDTLAISGDGNSIAFESESTNLVSPPDPLDCGSGSFSCPDIFVRDRVAPTATATATATATGTATSTPTPSAGGLAIDLRDDEGPGRGPICPGYTVHFDIIVANDGAVALAAVQVRVQLAPRTSPLLDSPRTTPGATYDPVTNSVSWTIPTLLPNETVTLQLLIRTLTSFPGGTTFTTQATAATGVPFPALATDEETTSVQACATATPVPTSTGTATPTATATATATATPTATATATATEVPSATATATATEVPAATATPTATATATATAEATATATATTTATATVPSGSRLYLPLILLNSHP